MQVYQILNQNSFLLVAVFVIAAITALVFRQGTRSVNPFGLGLLVAVIAGIAGVWLGLRADSTFAGQAELEQALHSGKPTMVEFYSNR